MNADGSASGPAILYSDGRISDARRLWLARRLPDNFERRIGNAADRAQPIHKLLDAQTRGDTFFSDSDHFHFGAKDVIVEWLTGAYIIDATVATTTGLMSLENRDWDNALLSAARLGRGNVPRIVAGDAIVGRVTHLASKASGLPKGLPVVAGCGDAGASALGAYADAPGTGHIHLGTSGWVAVMQAGMTVDRPRAVYSLASPTGNDTLSIAPVTTAAGALDWIAGALGLTLAEAVAFAEDAPRQPQGPLFLPYLKGERSPFADGDVRAAFLHLEAQTDATDLVASVLEGIAHSVRHVMEEMRVPEGPLRLIGGGALVGAMVRTLADVTGQAVIVARNPRQSTALGAARLAWRALGIADPGLSEPGAALFNPQRSATTDARYAAYVEASGMARRLARVLNVQAD